LIIPISIQRFKEILLKLSYSAKIKKHQTENELIREIDKIVAQREIEQEKIIEEKKIQKEKTIQQKIINFLKNQGIIPSEKDRENILKITGKYYAA
jgi:hypothetical protein